MASGAPSQQAQPEYHGSSAEAEVLPTIRPMQQPRVFFRNCKIESYFIRDPVITTWLDYLAALHCTHRGMFPPDLLDLLASPWGPVGDMSSCKYTYIFEKKKCFLQTPSLDKLVTHSISGGSREGRYTETASTTAAAAAAVGRFRGQVPTSGHSTTAR